MTLQTPMTDVTLYRHDNQSFKCFSAVRKLLKCQGKHTWMAKSCCGAKLKNKTFPQVFLSMSNVLIPACPKPEMRNLESKYDVYGFRKNHCWPNYLFFNNILVAIWRVVFYNKLLAVRILCSVLGSCVLLISWHSKNHIIRLTTY